MDENNRKKLLEVVECMKAWDNDPNVRPHDVTIENSAALWWCIGAIESIVKELSADEEAGPVVVVEKDDNQHTRIRFGVK